MKKWLSFFALALCLLFGLAAQAGAESFSFLPYEGAAYQLTYQENGDGTVTITGTTGTREGRLVLPETIDGKAVTAIGSYAFQNRSGFTGELVIPDTVTSIGSYTFDGCTGLTGSLDLTGVTDIGHGVFRNCAGFTALTLDDGLTSISNSAFRYCTGFADSTLTLPDSITKIGESAFAYCGFIGELTLGADLTSIGSAAFLNCGPFTGDLTIPDGVTEIGTATFAQCGFTGNLTLSSSLRSIGLNAFLKCGFTGDLVIPDSVTEIGEGAFDGCTGFTGSLTLGSGLSSIGDKAFRSTNFTGSLTIPNSVTEIGEYAFQNCDGFTGSLTIAGAQVIGAYAFHNCTGFTGDLTITGTGSTVIRSAAFTSCTGFTGNLTITGVTEIGASAFERCSGFTGLTLGQGLEIIYQNAFRDCTDFTGDLIIPDSVTLVEYDAFRGCTGFTGNLTVGGSSLTEIGEYAFHNCTGFTGNLTIGGSALTIGKEAFSGCTGFTGSLTIGDVSSIGENAFYGCTGFSGSLTLSGVDEIGWTAFDSCGFTGDLTILGSGAAVIDGFAFNKCEFTGTLSLSGVGEIKSGAFYGCSDLSGSLVLPDTLLAIGDQAFYECGFNGSLIFGSRLERIGQYAFRNCNGFTGDLILPDSVKEVGKGAFQSCSGFDGSLSLSRGLTLVDENVFRSCSGFTGTLTLPSGITSVGAYAFFGCAGFHALVLPPTLTEMGSGAFSSCTGFDGTLTLPQGLTEIGGSAFANCSGFTGTLILPDGMTNLGYNAFSGCSGFTGNLTIPDSVTSIGERAFENCSGFTSLTLGRGTSMMPRLCFSDCSGLRQIYLPDTITQIEYRAFHVYPDGIVVKVYYQGSEADWAAIDMDLSENNMFSGDSTIFFGSGTELPPAEGTQRLGTVKSVGEGTVTIDGLSYPLAEGLEANGAWAGEYVLYTVNSDGAVTSVTVLLRATGTLDDWVERLSPDPSTPAEPLVTLSGIEYDFSTLGDRSFLVYKDLLMGQRVVFYLDSTYTVYHIEPDPDSIITLVGYVISLSDSGEVTIGSHSFVPEEGVSVPEDCQGKFVKYQVRGLTRLSSIQPLTTDTGTLNAWDAEGQQLTISQKNFALSPLAGLTAAEVAVMVSYKVSYAHDDSGTVYQLELTVPAPGTFNEYTYRASFLMNATYDPTKTVNEYLAYQTPSEILLDAMEEEGFRVGVAAWEGVTILADSAIDITNVDELSLMPKDLFSAIILDMLEASCNLEVERGEVEKLNEVVASVQKWMSLVYGTDEVNLAALPEDDRVKIFKKMEASFFEEFPDMKAISDIGEIMDAYVTFLDVCTTVTDAVEIIYSNVILYNMSQSMKDVLRTMYDEACRNSYPVQLQLALIDCLEIINATDLATFAREMFLDVEVVAGKAVAKTVASMFWGSARTQIQLTHPEILVLQAAYSGSRLVCNQVFNTDEIVDQYWELLATVEVEHLLETSRATLAARFQRSGTVRDAQAYLDATGALFSIRKLDCDSAAKYVNAVDEALVSKLLALAGKTNNEFRENILSIRNSYQTGMDIARWGWVEYAMDRYPDLAEVQEQYQKLEQLQKTLKAACPVDVYVYDQSGALAASVVDERITCTGDAPMAIVKQGDVKTLYFYGDDQYNIVLTGYDEGKMDVVVTEYDQEGSVARTASFYDVALTKEQSYQTQAFPQSGEYTLTGEDSTAPVEPTVDTGKDAKSVTATIENGAFCVDGALLQTVTGAPGQEYTIVAVVPEDGNFSGWTCSGGTVAEPQSRSTTFRLPESGEVSLSAGLIKSFDPVYIQFTPDSWILEPGEQFFARLVYGSGVGSNFVWTSMDPQVATVDDRGYVTALSPGTTLIMVTTADRCASATCTVVVRDYNETTLTVLDGEGQTVTDIPNSPFTVEAMIPNGTLAEEDRCMIACYDADGRMISLISTYETQLQPDDSSARLTFQVDGGQGDITQIKLFFLMPWQESWPLGPAAVFESQ